MCKRKVYDLHRLLVSTDVRHSVIFYRILRYVVVLGLLKIKKKFVNKINIIGIKFRYLGNECQRRLKVDRIYENYDHLLLNLLLLSEKHFLLLKEKSLIYIYLIQ